MNHKEFGRKEAVMARLKYYLSICLEGLRKATKKTATTAVSWL
jgi:hypothetical protein